MKSKQKKRTDSFRTTSFWFINLTIDNGNYARMKILIHIFSKCLDLKIFVRYNSIQPYWYSSEFLQYSNSNMKKLLLISWYEKITTRSSPKYSLEILFKQKFETEDSETSHNRTHEPHFHGMNSSIFDSLEYLCISRHTRKSSWFSQSVTDPNNQSEYIFSRISLNRIPQSSWITNNNADCGLGLISIISN